MGQKLGIEGKLFRNTGSYASPVWNEVKNVTDLSTTIDKSEADFSSRSSRWKMIRGALKEAGVDFELRYDPTDEDWIALNTAFLADTAIEFWIADGPSGIEGTAGLRFSAEILKWGRNEPLEDSMTTPCTIKPCPSANDPAWYVAE